MFDRFLPGRPFEYRFVDDLFDVLYRSDRRFGQTFGIFAGLAIFIACLGLFGLAAYTTEQRTKEVGVRKVMGATAGSIVLLLTKDFARLVLLAILLATPVAYLVMQRWLEDFAYRVEISGWIFLIGGSVALLVALATVSYQAVRAALSDPVKALRYE